MLSIIQSLKFSLILTVFIIITCLFPSSHMPHIKFLLFKHADKLIHFLMYFLYTSMMIFEISRSNSIALKKSGMFWLSGGVAFFFGGIIEFLQSGMCIGRTGDVFDMCANCTGIFFALVFYNLIEKLMGVIFKKIGA